MVVNPVGEIGYIAFVAAYVECIEGYGTTAATGVHSIFDIPVRKYKKSVLARRL